MAKTKIKYAKRDRQAVVIVNLTADEADAIEDFGGVKDWLGGTLQDAIDSMHYDFGLDDDGTASDETDDDAA